MSDNKSNGKNHLSVKETINYVVKPSLVSLFMIILPIAISAVLGIFSVDNETPLLGIVIISTLLVIMFAFLLYQHRKAYQSAKVQKEKEIDTIERAFNNKISDIESELKGTKDTVRTYKELYTSIINIFKSGCKLHTVSEVKQKCPIYEKKRKKHIEDILVSLWHFVCSTSDIPIHDNNDVSVVLVFKKVDDVARQEANRNFVPWSSDWDRLHHNYKSKLTADELASSPNAAGLELLTSEKVVQFIHDKDKHGNYHKHKRDYEAHKKTGQNGSLFGYRMEINNTENELDVVAMLFISSFGIKICKNEDDDSRKLVENNYRTRVYPTFIPILENELIMLLSGDVQPIKQV